jgi:uncharacterized protein YqgC (DUF456 family)
LIKKGGEILFEIIGMIIGAILMLLGLAGCVLPILPGPLLSFSGLLLLALLNHFSPPLTSTLIIIMAILTLLAGIADYIIPLLGTKKYGTSKWGIWGAVLGMAVGIFFSPFGMLIGAFLGAIAMEWLVQKEKERALKAGWGVLIGTLWGTVLKLAVSGTMAYFYIRGLW